MSITSRILSRCRSEGACLAWTGAKADGYGQIGHQRRVGLTHRLVWAEANGDIPPGLLVDHMCHNRACCNLAHLRLVTNKQNAENRAGGNQRSRSGARGVSSHRSGKWQAGVTHNGKYVYGGLFSTVDEAAKRAAEMRDGVFTHSDDAEKAAEVRSRPRDGAGSMRAAIIYEARGWDR